MNFKETVKGRGDFDYLHKKQSGGSGQYGRVIGYIEPLEDDAEVRTAAAAALPSLVRVALTGVTHSALVCGAQENFEFVNGLVGNNIPPEFVSACEKGFREACEQGALTGHAVTGVRVVITDGAAHAVDSNEIAFRMASVGGFRQAFSKAMPTVLEPLMSVSVSVPQEHQGPAIAGINRRQGQIVDSTTDETGYCVVEADVPLSQMFGYSTDLRSITQGKGEFSMEYKQHSTVPRNKVEELARAWAAQRGKKEAEE